MEEKVGGRVMIMKIVGGEKGGSGGGGGGSCGGCGKRG